MTDYDVAVIGAGISGCTTAKNLKQDGLSVILFEETDSVGGLWQYKDHGYGVMKFTHINVSKHNYCFSDFPLPEDAPDFVHWSQMAKYINDYVDHFDVRKLIQFQTRVVTVKKNQNNWTISTKNLANNSEKTYTVRSVCICSGHHAKPIKPTFPGEETFKGQLYHSVDYKDAQINKLADKRVLIVGIGNSAVDIAANCAPVATKTSVSTRSGAWIFPNYLFGVPVDHYASRAMLWLPWKVLSTIIEGMVTMVHGSPQKWGLNPKMRMMQTQPTVSPTLIHFLQRGYIDIRPNIERFEEDGVVFTDGTRGKYDVVIFSTGYKIDLPFLDEETLKHIHNPQTNSISLYKNVFSPSIGQSLAFIGFLQPASGGLISMSEIQARWVGQIMLNKARLPTEKKMLEAIEKDEQSVRKRYVDRSRHTIQRDPILYCDEIGEMIHVRPTIMKNPSLAMNLLFGSCGSYQYRLQGPGKWNDAAKYVRKAAPPPLMKIFIYLLASPLIFMAVKHLLNKLRAKLA